MNCADCNAEIVPSPKIVAPEGTTWVCVDCVQERIRRDEIGKRFAKVMGIMEFNPIDNPSMFNDAGLLIYWSKKAA